LRGREQVDLFGQRSQVVASELPLPPFQVDPLVVAPLVRVALGLGPLQEVVYQVLVQDQALFLDPAWPVAERVKLPAVKLTHHRTEVARAGAGFKLASSDPPADDVGELAVLVLPDAAPRP